MEKLKAEVQQLSESDFRVFRSWIFLDEVKRREALPEVEKGQAKMVKELAESGAIQRPETVSEEAAINGTGVVYPWVDPAGRLDKAYLQGEAVLDDGKIYINRKSGLNLARPSSPDSGWELHNPPKKDEAEPDTASESVKPGAPAWKEPQSKTDLYNKGSEVTHQGAQWRSTADGNRAEPGTDNSWERIEG